MSARIWLKTTTSSALVTTEGKSRSQLGTDGPDVDTDRVSGENFVPIYADIMDPSAVLPTVAREHIKRVTYEGKIHEGFRKDGLYRHKGATLRVETYNDTQGGFGDGPAIAVRHQNISISGGSIRTVKEIYDRVRTGEITIDRNWNRFQHELDREASAVAN